MVRELRGTWKEVGESRVGLSFTVSETGRPGFHTQKWVVGGSFLTHFPSVVGYEISGVSPPLRDRGHPDPGAPFLKITV